MSKKSPTPSSSKREESIKRLMKDLSELEPRTFSASPADVEMLSMVVDDVIRGVDIAKRYPSFYQKLIQNMELRRLFLDVLESVEAEQKEEFIALPELGKSSLDFLSKTPLEPTITKFGNRSWQVKWQRTAEQLQTIFSPPGLAYRSAPDLFEGPRFTLVQEEVEVEGSSYEIKLECGPSMDLDDSFSISLTAISENSTGELQIPIRVTLIWGSYHESIILSEQGKIILPDISVTDIFDNVKENVSAELNLILEGNP
jgi:hypothetical protein